MKDALTEADIIEAFKDVLPPFVFRQTQLLPDNDMVYVIDPNLRLFGPVPGRNDPLLVLCRKPLTSAQQMSAVAKYFEKQSQ